MVKKRLAVSALAVSLALMTPGFSMATKGGLNDDGGKTKKKCSIVKDIGAGFLSLGALAGAAYGLYWANDYDVKKTVKPFVKLAAIGSALTASYLCVGIFILRKIVKSTTDSAKNFMNEQKKQFKKEINELGDTAKTKLKEVKTTAEEGLTRKLTQIQDTFELYIKKINPSNWLKSVDKIKQARSRNRFKNDIKKANCNFHKQQNYNFFNNEISSDKIDLELRNSVEVIPE